MTLFYVVLCVSLASFIFSIILIGSRNPKTPIWAADSLVANIYVPVIVGLFLLGICLFIDLLINLEDWKPGIKEIVASVLLAGATFFGLKLLGIKKRLAAYEEIEKASDAAACVIPFCRQSGEPEAPKPSKPGRAAA